jgi:hypothetical protein
MSLAADRAFSTHFSPAAIHGSLERLLLSREPARAAP